MTTGGANGTHVLVRKLAARGCLSPEESLPLVAICGPSRAVPRGAEVLEQNGAITQATVILSGIACRYKFLPSGRRQIVSFQIPGDITGLHSSLMPEHTASFCALRTSSVSYLRDAEISRIKEEFPQISRALCLEIHSDMSIYEEWLVCLGQRNALERVAHLLCEVFVRYQAVGLINKPYTFAMPITQSEIADATGLSQVHVNRTMRELRKRNIIGKMPHLLEILDWDKLQAIAGFDPHYLNLSPRLPNEAPCSRRRHDENISENGRRG